jgi:hypothetical protein
MNVGEAQGGSPVLRKQVKVSNNRGREDDRGGWKRRGQGKEEKEHGIFFWRNVILLQVKTIIP